MINTEKQKKFIKLLTENIGNKQTKSLKQLMLDAGYSESVALQQTQVLNSVKDKVKPLVGKLEKERDNILEAMAKKREGAGYSDLVRGLDITIKNIQLLGGEATENIKMYGWEDYKN